VSAWMSVYVIIWTGDGGDDDSIVHRGCVCVDDHEVEDRCGRLWSCQRAGSTE